MEEKKKKGKALEREKRKDVFHRMFECVIIPSF